MAQQFVNIWYEMITMQDPKTEGYFLIRSHLANVLIMTSYVLFVLKIGPSLMKNRKPYNLKSVIIVYNVVQIVLNFVLMFRGLQFALEDESFFCQLVSKEITPRSMDLARIAYYYYLLKLFDLVETVFYVLRKKYRQISVLHLYHHIGMILATWLGVKNFPGGVFQYVGIVNTGVHGVMYSYYLLAAWSPRYSQNITFKKSITILQLIQHAFYVVYYTAALLAPNCDFPKEPLILFVPNTYIMTILFINFYIKNYVKTKVRTNKTEKVQ